jgi:hypothetical protein
MLTTIDTSTLPPIATTAGSTLFIRSATHALGSAGCCCSGSAEANDRNPVAATIIGNRASHVRRIRRSIIASPCSSLRELTNDNL